MKLPRPDVLDRSVPPLVGTPPRMPPPEFEELTLANGLRVVFVRRSGVPLVSVDLVVRGGASTNQRDHAGLAALTADLLDEGTPTRNALEISDELERLGASLVSFAGRDASRVRMSVLASNFSEALTVFGEIVMDPSLDEAELDRVREEQLTRILQGRDEPGLVADQALSLALYGQNHPYGAPVLGTNTSVQALRQTDVSDYYRAHYHAGNATLIVAGHLAADSLESVLNDSLGVWRLAAGSEVRLPGPLGPQETTISIVDKKDAAQSEIRLGRVTTDRSTEDYYAIRVLNTVLGGSFTSRLNLNLREDKGFTYGAHSSFALRRQKGPFTAGAAVHTPATGEAVSEFMKEIRRIVEEPVPPDELNRARNFVALRLPQGFETVSDLANRTAELVLYDLPLDYFGEYIDKVLAVSADDVQDAARQYLSGGFSIVVAGDRSSIEKPLRALSVGSVTVVEPEDT